MARRYRLYDKGTPQRALQDAVNARFPERQATFFETVSKHVKAKPESVKGTFYRVLRDDGALPPEHRTAYIKAGVEASVIDALVPRANGRPARTRLQSLEAENASLRADLQDLTQVVARLTRRVRRLEERGSEGRGTG